MKFYYLSESFYTKYSSYSEILQKKTRPYATLIIEDSGVTFAIPMRTNINKNNHYCFITNEKKNSGLDYLKAVVISENTYINTITEAKISDFEFNKIKFKEKEIQNSFKKFLKDYIKFNKRYKKNTSIPIPISFQYSSLQYFHDELGI